MPAPLVAPDARTILPALGGAASISPQLSPGLERTSLARTLTSSWGRPCLATGHTGHTDMAPTPRVWQLSRPLQLQRSTCSWGRPLWRLHCSPASPCPGPPPPLSFHSCRTSCTLVSISVCFLRNLICNNSLKVFLKDPMRGRL